MYIRHVVLYAIRFFLNACISTLVGCMLYAIFGMTYKPCILIQLFVAVRRWCPGSGINQSFIRHYSTRHNNRIDIIKEVLNMDRWVIVGDDVKSSGFNTTSTVIKVHGLLTVKV